MSFNHCTLLTTSCHVYQTGWKSYIHICVPLRGGGVKIPCWMLDADKATTRGICLSNAKEREYGLVRNAVCVQRNQKLITVEVRRLFEDKSWAAYLSHSPQRVNTPLFLSGCKRASEPRSKEQAALRVQSVHQWLQGTYLSLLLKQSKPSTALQGAGQGTPLHWGHLHGPRHRTSEFQSKRASDAIDRNLGCSCTPHLVWVFSSYQFQFS